jgi:hypothetical protein
MMIPLPMITHIAVSVGNAVVRKLRSLKCWSRDAIRFLEITESLCQPSRGSIIRFDYGRRGFHRVSKNRRTGCNCRTSMWQDHGIASQIAPLSNSLGL